RSTRLSARHKGGLRLPCSHLLPTDAGYCVIRSHLTSGIEPMQHALRNTVMQALGFAVLTLVWARHRLQGYTKPNTVADENWEGRHAYVQDVVESWSRFLP